MTENPTKTKALELAIQGGGDPESVVKRAGTYHAFLTGGVVPPGAAAKPPTDKGATAGNSKANGAAAPDAATAAAAKKATAEKAAAEKAAAAKAAAESAAAEKAAAKAAKPATGKGASAQSVAADTKAPGGTNSYADVVAMLHKVQNAAGRPECFKILGEDGGGAKSVRDLKPTLYDAVCEACANVIADEGEPAGDGNAASDDDPLGDLTGGGAERDDMGLS